MKPVTQDRIRLALNKLSARYHKLTEADGAVIRKAALLGLKSCTGAAKPIDLQKLELELDYAEASKDQTDLEFRFARWQRQIKRMSDQRENIYAIQKAHRVSGLVDSTLTLGGASYRIKWADDQLALIPSDLPVLREYREVIVNLWINYVSYYHLNIWVYECDRWRPSTTEEVTARASVHDWAKGWQNEWEVHLDVGSGLDTESAGAPRVWFCACDVEPSY